MRMTVPNRRRPRLPAQDRYRHRYRDGLLTRGIIIFPRHRRHRPCTTNGGSGRQRQRRRRGALGGGHDGHGNGVPVVDAGPLERRWRARAARARSQTWRAREERVERASCRRRGHVRGRRGRIPPTLAIAIAVVVKASFCATTGACIRGGLRVPRPPAVAPGGRLAAVTVTGWRTVAFAGVPIGPFTLAFAVTVVVVPVASLRIGRRGPMASVVVTPEAVPWWRWRR